MIRVVINEPDKPDRIQDCSGDRVTFGRIPGNTIQLTHNEVSSKHGYLENRGGMWWVVDDNSTNHTYLDGRELAPGMPGKPLRDGATLAIGPFCLVVLLAGTSDEIDQTISHFDAQRFAERIVYDLPKLYARVADKPAEQRVRAMVDAIRSQTSELSAPHARAVLTLIEKRFALGGDHDAQDEVADVAANEEFYRVGGEVLTSLSEHFLGKRSFRSASDAEKFGKRIEQALDITFDWFARSIASRAEFGEQVGADITGVFSLEGNPLKRADSASQVAEYLLDWESAQSSSQARAHLELAYRDLSMHQLGLLAGAQRAVQAVLERVSPAEIEKLAASEGTAWLKMMPTGVRAWDYYRAAHKELVEESGKLFRELVSPAIREGYMRDFERRVKLEGGGSSTDDDTKGHQS